MIIAIIGFLLLVVGLSIGFFTNRVDISYIATRSGIITEFIAAVFFYLYNKTVRQLKEYYDGLLKFQNVLLSFKLVDEISDEVRKAEMMGKILDNLQYIKSVGQARNLKNLPSDECVGFVDSPLTVLPQPNRKRRKKLSEPI